MKNYTRLIIASNHEWVVPAGMEERRFVILDVSPARMKDTDYFAKLLAQMDKRGCAALLEHLLNVDLSKVNLRQIPKTAGLLDSKLLSLSPVERFWQACLWEGTNGDPTVGWAQEVRCASLHDFYSEHAATRGQSRRAVQSDLGKALKSLVPGLGEVRHRTSGPGASQERYWIFPSLDECRAAFCVKIEHEIDWGAPVQPLVSKSRRGK